MSFFRAARSLAGSPEPPASGEATARLPSGLSCWRLGRAILLALALLPWNALWAAEIVGDVMYSLLAPPICTLIAVAAANALVRQRFPRLALSSGELVVVYVFLAVSVALCSEWTYVSFPHAYSYGLYADRNPWAREHILPHLPSWLFLPSAEGLDDFRRGGYGFWHMLSRLGVWWRVLGGWTVFLGLLCGSMLFLNALMREQWTRRERLAFPIIQLPLLLTRPEAPAWRSRPLWLAFAVLFAVDLLNGVSFLVPSVPSVNVRFLAGRLGDALPWLDAPPWTALGWLQVGIFPYMAAIGVFMPSDLLFSLIFFFWARKALQVGMETCGYEQGVFGGGGLVPSAPYFSEQTWGAVAALLLAAVVNARGYLREVSRHVLRGSAFTADELRPRSAALGLALCMGGLVALCAAAGIPVWVSLAYVVAFLAFSAVLARMRAQVGPPIHEMAFMGPHQLVVAFGGSGTLGEADTARVYHLFFMANRIHRSHPMPHQLEGLKLAEGSGVSARALTWLILGATVAGALGGMLAYLHRGYVHGAQPAWGEASSAVRTLTEQRHPPNATAVAAMLVGFGIVVGLDALRFRMPGFPLHPVGYALSMNYGIDYCWFGLLLALLAKTVATRAFGLKGYEKLRLVALGALLGEMAAELVWATVSLTTDTVTYSVSFYNRAGWLK